MKNLIFLSPIFNEEENIDYFLDKINKEFPKCNVLLIDDGSTDNSWIKIKKLSFKYSNLKAVRLAKNYGKNIALRTGFDYIDDKSSLVITLDSDLQHPLKSVNEMLLVLKDHNIDYCDSIRINERNFFRGIFSNLYNFILKILKVSDGKKMSDFKVLNYKVVNVIKNNNDPYFSYSNFLNSLNFKKKITYYKADKRYEGSTKFNFKKLFLLAIANIIFYSSFLHYFVFVIFLTNLFISIINIIYFESLDTVLILTINLIIALFSINFFYLKRVLNKLDQKKTIISDEINFD